jgi:sec-independent protein translocase protein TatA
VPFEGAFSPLHWLIIAVVALIVLGPRRLPEVAQKAGRAWRDFQDAQASDADPTDTESDATSDGTSDVARQVGGAVRELRRMRQELLGDEPPVLPPKTDDDATPPSS